MNDLLDVKCFKMGAAFVCMNEIIRIVKHRDDAEGVAEFYGVSRSDVWNLVKRYASILENETDDALRYRVISKCNRSSDVIKPKNYDELAKNFKRRSPNTVKAYGVPPLRRLVQC